MPQDLLTIKEIAGRLDLPESNIRYYRDKFEEYLPHVGQGRKRRYLPQALEVFTVIAENLRANTPSEEIAMELSRRYPKTPQIQDGHDGLVRWPDAGPDPISALLKSQAKALEDLSGLLKGQLENAPRVDLLRKEQQQIKRALLQLWRRQEKIKGMLSGQCQTGPDHRTDELLDRLHALERVVERGNSPDPVIQSEMDRFDAQIEILAARTEALEEKLHSREDQRALPEGSGAEFEDLLLERIQGVEERLNAASLEMHREMERTEQSLLEVHRSLSSLSRLDLIEAEMSELAPQSGLETMEQGVLKLSTILEMLGGRVAALEEGLAALPGQGELETLRIDLSRRSSAQDRMERSIGEQSSAMAQLRAETSLIRPSLKQLNDLGSSLNALVERLDGVEARLADQEKTPSPIDDLNSLSATISRLNHSLESMSARVTGLEQKLGSEIDRLNTYVHTCWSGVQKVSKALKSHF
jgi:DNA-binding transcriptional MerR regulator